MSRVALTPAGQVIALLCSRLALPAGAPEPLTNAEWRELAGKLAAAGKSPAGLLDVPISVLGGELEVEEHSIDRIQRLLDRGGQFALELEQLSDRGVWLLTTAEALYPARLKERLGMRAPATLFGAGEPALLSAGGVAVAGSRDADEASNQFAIELGEKCAAAGVNVISGAARGIDRLAMNAALANGAASVGVLADSLERTIREPECRRVVLDGRLTLVTPYHYSAHFTVGNAMGRNRLIYCLADFAVVVAASAGTGGTWAGAMENLKSRWVPLFVREAPQGASGNAELIAKGAIAVAESATFAQMAASAQGWGEEKLREPQSILWEQAPATATAQSEAAGTGEPTVPRICGIVREELEHFFSEPRSQKDIAANFKLKPAQLRKLISAGLAANLIERVGKPKRPIRYVAVRARAARLFCE